MDGESFLPRINLNEYEKEIYSYLFNLADMDKDGYIGSDDAYPFFTKCQGVNLDQLREVWNMVAINQHKLNKNAFAVALRLVCLIQQGRVPSINEAIQNREWHLPKINVPMPSIPNKQSFDNNNDWSISMRFRNYSDSIFASIPKNNPLYLDGKEASEYLSRSGLNMTDLAKIWNLADTDMDGRLTNEEFCLSLFLILAKLANKELPTILPDSLRSKKEGNFESFKQVGDECAQNGDYDSAEKYYNFAIQRGLNQLAGCIRQRAFVKFSQNKVDEAIKDSTLALQYDNKYAQAYFQRSLCYLQKGSFDEALNDAQLAIEIDPHDPLIAQQIFRVKETIQNKQIAEDNKKKGRWSEAFAAYEALIAVCPELLSVQLGYAEASLHTKNPQKAMAAVKNAITKEPNNIEALWLHIRIRYHTTNEISEVSDFIKHLLKLDPAHQGAIDLKKKMERLQNLKQKGNIAFQQKDYKESINIYTEAISEEDKRLPTAFSSVLFANRAAAHKILKNYDDAIRDLTSAIERNSSYVKAYIRRGQCYEELNLWDEAVKDYSTALSQEPFNADYGAMHAKAQLQLKELQKRNYYEIMGLSPFAGIAEIKKAYRILALKYHPDKVASSGISPLKAEQLFKEIQYCNEILSDPEKKAAYDRELQLKMSNTRFSAPQTSTNYYPQYSYNQSTQYDSQNPFFSNAW